MAFSPLKDYQARVLVVDDNEAKRYTVTHLLKRAGYIVEEVDTGLQGLQRTIEMQPDLVILDINLPDINGFDVCRRIRQNPDVASVIVLQLSAEHVLTSDRVHGLDEGADAYISQPVENEELLATIKALLRMRLAEKKAQKLAQEWEITFNSIESGVLLINRDLSIARHNNAIASFVDAPETLIGKSWDDCRHILMGSKNADLIEKLKQTLTSQQDDFMLDDGRWVHVVVQPVLAAPQRFNGAVCIINDITYRHKASEELRKAKKIAEQASEAKTEFLANMSHEMRTPMNVVLGISSILSRNTSLDEKHHKLVTTLQSSADSLLALINDLLDIAKIEARSVDIEAAPFDLNELMQNVFDQMKIRALEKSIAFELKCDLPAGQSAYIGDSARLMQILLNLVGNAIKFTDAGSVLLQVSPEADGLRIDVRDSGIGIAPEFRQVIFEKFTQGDASINRTHGGTGLGLAITKSLVEMMNGRISVDSVVGEGSTFTVRLPLQSCPATSDVQPSSTGGLQQVSNHSKGNVLLVEDHPSNVLLATTLLEDFGFSVEVANNGLQALQKLKSQFYDVVLMDVQMPGLDGLEATRQYREFERNNQRLPVPIIGMTAHAMDGYKNKCLQIGMNDYISKPFDADELKSKLHLYMSRKAAQAV